MDKYKSILLLSLRWFDDHTLQNGPLVKREFLMLREKLALAQCLDVHIEQFIADGEAVGAVGPVHNLCITFILIEDENSKNRSLPAIWTLNPNY